ncbi:ImmA/IrrE family metallo-endopeptidase [Bradyrhizobium sp.]|uniref:ImmA/IrrE family metallo-endopeptidase n=1 Tax=Bradyrhizobium sp. TaxID=376 RepID=UPI004037F7E3
MASHALPTRLPPERIASIAEQAAEAFSYMSDLHIERVVDELGGRIRLKDFWDKSTKSGSLEVSSLKDFDIFIPSHTTYERDRFTIAHELGHYILHYLTNSDPRSEQKFTIDRYGDNAIETEANLFAFSFLMPERKFREQFDASNGEISSVARFFGVSDTAARVRANMLKLHGKPKTAGSAASFSAA